MDRSINRTSFRACVVAGNRKPSRADVPSRFVQVDPRRPLRRGDPQKVLESFSKEIEGADVYFDAPGPCDFSSVQMRPLHLKFVKMFTCVNISSAVIIIKKYLCAIYL